MKNSPARYEERTSGPDATYLQQQIFQAWHVAVSVKCLHAVKCMHELLAAHVSIVPSLIPETNYFLPITAPVLKLVRRHILPHGEVQWGRLQVLSQRQNVYACTAAHTSIEKTHTQLAIVRAKTVPTCISEVQHGIHNLVVLLSQSQHEGRLGEDAAFLGSSEDIQRLDIACP